MNLLKHLRATFPDETVIDACKEVQLEETLTGAESAMDNFHAPGVRNPSRTSDQLRPEPGTCSADSWSRDLANTKTSLSSSKNNTNNKTITVKVTTTTAAAALGTATSTVANATNLVVLPTKTSVTNRCLLSTCQSFGRACRQ